MKNRHHSSQNQAGAANKNFGLLLKPAKTGLVAFKFKTAASAGAPLRPIIRGGAGFLQP
jgi:hypothetical protein